MLRLPLRHITLGVLQYNTNNLEIYNKLQDCTPMIINAMFPLKPIMCKRKVKPKKAVKQKLQLFHYPSTAPCQHWFISSHTSLVKEGLGGSGGSMTL